MQANIYIHIGLHKTGTTSIQATFFKNRRKLLAHGINYLPLSENHSVTLYPLFIDAPHRYRPNRLAGIDTVEKAAKKNAATERALRHTLDSNTCGSLVISGEDLSRLATEDLQRLRDRLAPYAARFRVIVYIRDPYSTVTSIFQQRLRRGQTAEQIIAAPPRPHYPRIGAALELFGRENVDIRRFDPARFINGDLIADFLAAIEASPALAKDLDAVRANVSLSHEATYLLNAINNHYRESKHGMPDRDRPVDLPKWLAAIPGQPFRCPPEFLLAAQPLIDEDLRWLREQLGEPMFPDRPIPSEVPPYWSEETLSAIALLLNDLARGVTQEETAMRAFFARLKTMLRQ